MFPLLPLQAVHALQAQMGTLRHTEMPGPSGQASAAHKPQLACLAEKMNLNGAGWEVQ